MNLPPYALELNRIQVALYDLKKLTDVPQSVIDHLSEASKALQRAENQMIIEHNKTPKRPEE